VASKLASAAVSIAAVVLSASFEAEIVAALAVSDMKMAI
jgi:hypothetical protein